MTTTLIKTASTGHKVTVNTFGHVYINDESARFVDRTNFGRLFGPDLAKVPPSVMGAVKGSVLIALTADETKALTKAIDAGHAAQKAKWAAETAKERAYDNLHNEGGEGYNPHRVASFERPDGLDSY
jgi:hypothetical protein